MKEIKPSSFSPDVIELLKLLYTHQVEYLIVGGQAVIFYGHVRLTGDVDIFYHQTKENVKKLYHCLCEFWNNDIPGSIHESDLMGKNVIIQFGVIPNRVDLMSSIEAVNFGEAWITRESVKMRIKNEIFYIYFINLDLLLRNKEKLSREKDKEDLKFLRRLKEKQKNKFKM